MRNLGFDQRDQTPEPAFAGVPAAKAAPATAAAVAARTVAVLGPTLRFKGELSADEDFVLQGRLEGSINHTQSVTIGADGVVVGNIHARIVTIDGSVEGDLHGTESVIVHATGRVNGNIFSPRVGLVDGALFNGRIDMGARQTSAAAPSTAKGESAGVPLSVEETERMLGSKG